MTDTSAGQSDENVVVERARDERVLETPRDLAARKASPLFQKVYWAVAPIRNFFGAMNIIYVPLIVGLIAFAFLYAPQQTIELYRVLFDNFLRQSLLDWSIAVGCFNDSDLSFDCFKSKAGDLLELGGSDDRSIYLRMGLTLFGVWLMAVSLRGATLYAIGRLGFLAPRESATGGFMLAWAPRVIGLLPVLGFSLGVYTALYKTGVSADAAEPAQQSQLDGRRAFSDDVIQASNFGEGDLTFLFTLKQGVDQLESEMRAINQELERDLGAPVLRSPWTVDCATFTARRASAAAAPAEAAVDATTPVDPAAEDARKERQRRDRIEVLSARFADRSNSLRFAKNRYCNWLSKTPDASEQFEPRLGAEFVTYNDIKSAPAYLDEKIRDSAPLYVAVLLLLIGVIWASSELGRTGYATSVRTVRGWRGRVTDDERAAEAEAAAAAETARRERRSANFRFWVAYGASVITLTALYFLIAPGDMYLAAFDVAKPISETLSAEDQEIYFPGFIFVSPLPLIDPADAFAISAAMAKIVGAAALVLVGLFALWGGRVLRGRLEGLRNWLALIVGAYVTVVFATFVVIAGVLFIVDGVGTDVDFAALFGAPLGARALVLLVSVMIAAAAVEVRFSETREAIRRGWRGEAQVDGGFAMARREWWREIGQGQAARVRTVLVLLGLAATALIGLLAIEAAGAADPDTTAILSALAATAALSVGAIWRRPRRVFGLILAALGALFLLFAIGVAAVIFIDIQEPAAFGFVALALGGVFITLGLLGLFRRLPFQLSRWTARGAARTASEAGRLRYRLRKMTPPMDQDAAAANAGRKELVLHTVPPWPLWRQFAAVSLFIGFAFLCAYFPVDFSQTTGALFLFGVFIALLAQIFTQLRIWGARLGFRLILVLFAIAVGLSAADLNDNHRVATYDARLDEALQAEVWRPGAAVLGVSQSDARVARQGFVEWLEHRAKQPRFDPSKPVPVYVVAAQGGGIYAAAHTTLLLTRIQRYCPLFARHLFAISSVSGGSVGAAMYASLAKHYGSEMNGVGAEDLRCAALNDIRPVMFNMQSFLKGSDVAPGDRQAQTDASSFAMYALARQMVAQDFLSPLFGGAFFPDFVARFSPSPLERFSRARALEAAFAASWDQAHLTLAKRLGAQLAPADASQTGDAITRRRLLADLLRAHHTRNPLRAGFLRHWNPALNAPALLINTTETSTGRRRVIAPFTFGEGRSDMRFFPLGPDDDVTLATAASLSARFPWLTPSGWFCDPKEPAAVGEDDDGAADQAGAAARALAKDDDPSIEDQIADLIAACDPEEETKVRLVDGGYFENSGVATALELIKDLEQLKLLKAAAISSINTQRTQFGGPQTQTCAEDPAAIGERECRLAALPDFDIKLIVLTRGGFAEARSAGLNEVMGPIRTMLKTRSSRTYIEINRAEAELVAGATERLDEIDSDRRALEAEEKLLASGVSRGLIGRSFRGDNPQLATVRAALQTFEDRRPGRYRAALAESSWLKRARIYDNVTPLPLGWRLSSSSIDQIGAMAGEPTTCDAFDTHLTTLERIGGAAAPDDWQKITNCLHDQLHFELHTYATGAPRGLDAPEMRAER